MSQNQNVFDKLNEWINDTEGSLVNATTAFAPWLAPLVPAYMTYQHMIDFVHIPPVLAFVLALLVEILGFGTVSTFLAFWFYNRRERAKGKKAPIGLVIVSFCFYLGLILISNVLIDIAKEFGNANQLSWAIISVRALLTLQMIPGALIVAVRTQHRGLLKEIKAEMQATDGKLPESSGKLPDWRDIRPRLSVEEVTNIAYARTEEIVKAFPGISDRTARNWRKHARSEIKIPQ